MHLIPDRVLDMWDQGYTVREIAYWVRDTQGNRFTGSGIEQAIRWARRQGDPRADKRLTRPV